MNMEDVGRFMPSRNATVRVNPDEAALMIQLIRYGAGFDHQFQDEKEYKDTKHQMDEIIRTKIAGVWEPVRITYAAVCGCVTHATCVALDDSGWWMVFVEVVE